MGRKMRTYPQYDSAIGERASHIRNVLGMSQQQVACIVGVTRQTIAYYENGRTPMRADVVRSLCEIYGISPMWLLGMTDTLTLFNETGGRTINIVEESPSIPSPIKEGTC